MSAWPRPAHRSRKRTGARQSGCFQPRSDKFVCPLPAAPLPVKRDSFTWKGTDKNIHPPHERREISPFKSTMFFQLLAGTGFAMPPGTRQRHAAANTRSPTSLPMSTGCGHSRRQTPMPLQRCGSWGIGGRIPSRPTRCKASANGGSPTPAYRFKRLKLRWRTWWPSVWSMPGRPLTARSVTDCEPPTQGQKASLSAEVPSFRFTHPRPRGGFHPNHHARRPECQSQ